MAMDKDAGQRRQAIATALAAELARQGRDEGIDLDALADAVDLALDPPPPMAEGRRPNELNSTNDD